MPPHVLTPKGPFVFKARSKINEVDDLTKEELTHILSYTGLILVAHELIKSLIVKPIKFFYCDMTFAKGSPFKSYESDVLSRHKNEFEACLLYLSDFMEAIDSDDVLTIQELREHRNDLAHNIVHKLQEQEVKRDLILLEKINKTLCKISKYQMYMEIGADPKFKGIDWDSAKGPEYIVFEEVLKKLRIFDK